MKKKIFSILAIFLTLAMFVGCTPNTTSYMDATNKVNSWSGSTITGKFDYDFEVKDPESKETVSMKFPISFEGKQEGMDKAEVTMKMDLKTLKASMTEKGMSEDEKKEINALPDNMDFKVFVNNDKMYIQKDIFAFANPDSVKDIKEDYLAISTADASGGLSAKAISYLNSEEFKADIMKLVDTALGDFKPTVDYKVDGNTYTFNATSDEIIDNVINGSSEIVKNWDKVSDSVVAIAKKLEPTMTDEDIKNLKDLKNEYDEAKIKESAKEFKDMLKGSSISEKSTFEDDKYTSEVKLNVNFNNFMSIKLTGSATQVKDESVKVNFPTSAKEITMEEYLQMMMPPMDNIVTVRVNGEDITFDDPEALPKIINDRTMLGARTFYEKIGAKVEWNGKARTVTVTKDNDKVVLTIDSDKALVNGKAAKLDSPAVIINDRTYIPVRFVSEAFGYKVKYTEDEVMPTVDIYNITDEELSAKIAEIEKEDNYRMVASMLSDMKSEEVEKQIKEYWEGEEQTKLLEAKKELESNKELLEKYQKEAQAEEEKIMPVEEKAEVKEEKTEKAEDPAAKVEDAAKKVIETLFAVVR
ncbi:stalk domain-containing protein [Peptoniphilus sp.]|uniref:stalk domain-containing protein n=1 Tax=Peptoniphilus sp. TaxID=1971214 RepID=UPI003D917221